MVRKTQVTFDVTESEPAVINVVETIIFSCPNTFTITLKWCFILQLSIKYWPFSIFQYFYKRAYRMQYHYYN